MGIGDAAASTCVRGTDQGKMEMRSRLSGFRCGVDAEAKLMVDPKSGARAPRNDELIVALRVPSQTGAAPPMPSAVGRRTLRGLAARLCNGSRDAEHYSYRPYLISAKPGDTLRVDLVNKLGTEAADNLINLHTHGSVVSPRPDLPRNSPVD
jgi:FtsP/CotA-like multicopper oxidase with cupredoxin domain